MDADQKRKFHVFIIKEEKEYACANCGSYSMKSSKIEFINDYEAEVKIKCQNCDYEKNLSTTYYED